MDIPSLETLLENAFARRLPLLDADHQTALRLFAGFYEGYPDLVLDLYGRTLVIFDFSDDPGQTTSLLEEVQTFTLSHFSWLTCILQKVRNSADAGIKRGKVTYGNIPEEAIVENGIRYALDLTLSQDAGFFLDTRNLRKWLIDHSDGLEVLNTFAYTGSLGVAALAGGAQKVIQLDRNSRYMEPARRSAMLNHLDLGRMKLIAVDFFAGVGRFKREGALFDLIILDPPFFSVSERGRVDQVGESNRLINKVRPLVKDGGRIVAVNNALFLPGQEYMDGLQGLCKDGYLEIEEVIPVPDDITGYPETRTSHGPVDNAPFTHSTKMVVLGVSRK